MNDSKTNSYIFNSTFSPPKKNMRTQELIGGAEILSLQQDLQVFVDGVCVATLQSLMLCYPERMLVEMRASADGIQVTANSSSGSYSDSETLSATLTRLSSAMQAPVHTYIGGLPGLSVSAFYRGCLEISVNGRQLDFDEAVSKDNSIKSHSCPPVVSAPDPAALDRK
uniref:Laminin G domain-containing protein n=1 Tax=Sinocyclocheilus rhinocerous TaxID=307959 RepID=A0A673LX56_9TELE